MKVKRREGSNEKDEKFGMKMRNKRDKGGMKKKSKKRMKRKRRRVNEENDEK